MLVLYKPTSAGYRVNRTYIGVLLSYAPCGEYVVSQRYAWVADSAQHELRQSRAPTPPALPQPASNSDIWQRSAQANRPLQQM